ncbi:AraD1 family protein [Notoacmeibacter sp. MSK16QG-6]|uniref:AraD1 family protein n=1 Tax=Notoacmeibacter sp. MSK16QG-6 TaxID=2957982 RepID=UPI00209F5D1C|nr:AraD1 family protein [Notoacmeibacter sp. MSK16QG-6]MCP1200257.1 GguC family protein [Notoacmeibacter sp. MSK16QG-6]
MHLSCTKDGRVICRRGQQSRVVEGASSIVALAKQALSAGQTLAEAIDASGLGDPVDLSELLREGMIDAPIRHEDPAHLHVTGTGLTHTGSASTRNAMHESAATDETDSMRMFRMGMENGKPQPGEIGVQPEWFYKGNGHTLVGPGNDLVSPAFAEDAGEEPEIAGIYIVAEDGAPVRLGFTLANEFSDHVTEKHNYLWLAHSKLRPCAIGPELLVGELPDDIRGVSRIHRDASVLWEKPFLSGEANMSHAIANLEHHHFKYDVFRQPGDIHIHTFGTATLSFADGIETQDGDIFEIEAAAFGLPLRNRLKTSSETGPVTVRRL